MKKAILIAVPALLFVALVAYSIVQRLEPRSARAAVRAAVPVAAAAPRVGPISRVLSYAGTLEPEAMVTVTPKVAGRIDSILVKESDWVRQGQIVAVMETDVVRLQMEQAENAFRAAEAQYEKAKRGVRSEELANAEALVAQAEKDVASAQDTYERLGTLYREGSISRSRYEDAERQLSTARTQLDNARRSVRMMQQGASAEELSMAESQMKAMQAQYQLARLGMDNARISSPLEGRVVKVHTDAGNMAGQGTPVVTVVRDDPMLVKVPVPERHFTDVKARLETIEARVSPNALPGRVFEGRLRAVSPTIDPASRTFTVDVELPNGDGALHAGMYARVELVVERVEAALLVPAVALVTRDGRGGVFVVREGNSKVARFVEVRTGIAAGDVVQVLDGIDPDDLVVSEGNSFLEDGETVTPAP